MHSRIIICLFSALLSFISMRLHSQERTSIAWTADWSYDDEYVAVGNDKGELVIYETRSWKPVKYWTFDSTTITRLEWNPRFPILAVASVSHGSKVSAVQLYDLANERVINELPGALQGRGVSWKPDGTAVAFVGRQGRISIYGKDGILQKALSITNPSSFFDIDWHPTENLLLAVEEDVYIIGIDNDTLVAKYDDGSKEKGILCASWHPVGEFFVTGDYGHEGEGEPSYLRFWKKSGGMFKEIKASKAEYRNAKWSPDGKFLAAAADELLVFDPEGQLLSRKKFDAHNLWGIAWSRKGNRIITSDQAGNVRITDTYGKLLYSFVL
jgi:tricorn protease-like protein